MDNPYAPPASESAALPRIVIYSPGHVAWATFLGAPIAGCVLLALNYRRFGNATAASFALMAGFVGTVVVLAIAFVLPENFPSFVLPAAYTFGMYQSVKSLQGRTSAHLLANGAIKGSGWVATGVGILSLILTIVALFAAVLVAPEGWFPEE